ncbi:HNH endonuclease [Nocardia arthritidis]|uniref:HNH endonuclease n=1 Tax=Nocardia arthritidis TaxID=228602 RepID=A0A6G9YT37_9NOCA|nr:HNH endonuclease [Nocardia arthritidis]
MTGRRRSGLDHRAYRRAKDKLRRQSQICHLCGGVIDLKLSTEYPNHPDAWTADHITPRSRGGHLLGEMKAAHRRCNSARGNRPPEQVQLPTSRVWVTLGRPEDSKVPGQTGV